MNEDELVKQWTKMYSEVLQFAQCDEAGDRKEKEIFADIYHSLAHSPLAATMIQLEHSNAQVSNLKVECQDDAEGDYERILKESNASHLRETQRREFRKWVQTVHEDASGECTGTMSRSDSAFTMSLMTSNLRAESFTITLGAQMKAMHNLRLVAADIFEDVCKYPEELEVALPQRLQTSMALYTNNLSGLVLLTDDDLSHHQSSNMAKEFNNLCNSATEFHFPSFEQQVESLRNEYLEPAIAWRLEYTRNQYQPESLDQQRSCTPAPTDRLKPGDFYVTNHSNLKDVHVVFHMKKSTDLSDGNINSRHLCVMGLRHVLKSAVMNSVSTLTVPLLLSHTMEENMTVAWCMKRAELVYKCMKGFLMEVTSWGGSELTVQFLVPKDISKDVFSRLSLMLPSIFRISNPIRVTQ